VIIIINQNNKNTKNNMKWWDCESSVPPLELRPSVPHHHLQVAKLLKW